MRVRTLLLTALAVVVLEAPAGATTTVSLSPDGRTVTLTGDDAPSALDVFAHTEGADATYVEVKSYYDPFAPGSSADYLEAGPGCAENSPPGGSQVYVRCGPTVAPERKIVGVLGGGDDYVQVFATFPGGVALAAGAGDDTIDGYTGMSPAAVTYPIVLSGGAGSDSLVGDGGADDLDGGDDGDSLNGRGGEDTLTGGGGPDTLTGGDHVDVLRGGDAADALAGGAGNDDLGGGIGNDGLEGGTGDDDLDGGPGDDRFEAAAAASATTEGRDEIVGGAGIDAMGYQSEEGQPLSRVSLDDVADDGRANPDTGASIEQDDVRSDVEQVSTSRFGARTTVVGNAADNTLNAFGDRNDVRGGAGADLIVTTCYPNCVDGGDVVDGGAGDDEIRTGDGEDDITGGSGRDEIYADNCSGYTCADADTIDVVDGERDEVSCGGGGDVVRADPLDVLTMCATVTIVGGPQQTTTQEPGPASSGMAPAGLPAAIVPTPLAPALAPPPAATCRVPSLRRLTLKRASRRLRAAGCRLGGVRRSRRARGPLVVVRQTHRAGTVLPRRAKVGVSLGRARR